MALALSSKSKLSNLSGAAGSPYIFAPSFFALPLACGLRALLPRAEPAKGDWATGAGEVPELSGLKTAGAAGGGISSDAAGAETATGWLMGSAEAGAAAGATAGGTAAAEALGTEGAKRKLVLFGLGLFIDASRSAQALLTPPLVATLGATGSGAGAFFSGAGVFGSGAGVFGSGAGAVAAVCAAGLSGDRALLAAAAA